MFSTTEQLTISLWRLNFRLYSGSWLIFAINFKTSYVVYTIFGRICQKQNTRNTIQNRAGERHGIESVLKLLNNVVKSRVHTKSMWSTPLLTECMYSYESKVLWSCWTTLCNDVFMSTNKWSIPLLTERILMNRKLCDVVEQRCAITCSYQKSMWSILLLT